MKAGCNFNQALCKDPGDRLGSSCNSWNGELELFGGNLTGSKYITKSSVAFGIDEKPVA